MLGLLLGVVLGASAVTFILRLLSSRGHPLVTRVLGPGATAILLEECPDVSVGAPVVPPQDLPEVITVEEIRADPAALRRRIKHARTLALVTAIGGWKPRRHRSESKFQESFLEFLSREGARLSPEFDPAQLRRHPRLPFAEGRVACPDFTYADVLIELKRGLAASGETDRALGQLLRYLWLWRTHGTAVLVICDQSDRNLKALAQNYVRGWRAQGLPVMAVFVRDTGEDTTAEVPEVEDAS